MKNPAGANEVLRTLSLEPGEHDLLGVLNDNTADGRDISWVWDADFELLAGRSRSAEVTCSGTRAAELALPGSSTPASRRRASTCRETSRARCARPRPAGDAERAAVRAAHLHGDARVARAARPARGGEQRMVVTRAEATVAASRAAGHLARPRVRRLPGRPFRSGESSQRASGDGVPGPILEIGAGSRARLARSCPCRAPGDRARPRSVACSAALEYSRRRAEVETVCADARRFQTSRRQISDSSLVPMQTLQLFGGEAGRVRVPTPRARATCAPARLLACAIVTE